MDGSKHCTGWQVAAVFISPEGEVSGLLYKNKNEIKKRMTES